MAAHNRTNLIALAILAALITPLLIGTCGGNGTSTQPVSVDLGPDGATGAPVSIDLDPLIGPTSIKGATAKRIETDSELIGGEAAQGRVGDYLLQNDKIRVIIQQPDRTIGAGPFGGNLIDADIIRADGQGRDVMGEISVFFQLGRTVNAQTVEVVRDGSKGGAAVIAATGPDEILDYLNISSVVSQYLGTAIELPFDPDKPMSLTMTNYYILRPGDSVVRFITAFRNGGAEPQYLVAGDLIDSGGTIEFFNPSSSLKGFGYVTAIPENMDFLAFRGKEASYAYAPPQINGKEGGAYMAISGVAGTILGTTNVLGILLGSKAPDETTEGAIAIEPGKTASYERWIAIGDSSISSLTDELYRVREIGTGTVSGRVVDSGGSPVADVRVSAIQSGAAAAITQFVSDAQGNYAGTLPAGSYSFSTLTPGRTVVTPGSATISLGSTETTNLTLSKLTHVTVNVASPSASPLPAKVTFLCEGSCPQEKSSQLRDKSFDALPESIFQINFIDHSGTATVPLAPGAYRAVVSRGISYSAWPQNFKDSGGELLTVGEGGTANLSATLAKVVDTSEYLSSDFHVHAINSPDSPVPNTDRVISFMSEGVDVLVSSDHDYVTDFAPVVKQLGALSTIRTIVGNELTTFDYGHFNGFPVQTVEGSINGGAFDWAGGTSFSVHPDAIFKHFEDQPGEQVVQVNHPNWGYLGYIGIDVASGATSTPPARFRMAVPDGLSDSDTKLFSERFTAMELYNGFDLKTFYTCLNWWLGFLNRGFVVTGTAVSDTHRWTTTQSGMPRSFIRIGSGKDSVATFDEAAFVKATNEQKLVGTNGPFVRLYASNAQGEKVETGETLGSGGGAVTLTVEVQTPAWFKANKIELYSNQTDSVPAAGKTNNKAPTPRQVQEITMDDATHLVAGAEGGAEYKRYVITAEFSDTPTKDSYYLVMVRGEEDLFPIVTDRGVAPFAFTNPVFVDVDGSGFKPLQKRAAPPRWRGHVQQLASPPVRKATEADFWKVVKAVQSHH